MLADWLHEGPESGPREGLERTLAATRRVGQRPGWTLPERWLPMQLTMARTRSQRPILAIVMLALLIVALVATALYIGSQRRLPPSPFRNGAVVYEQDGDLFIADQLDGTPRPLVAGPEADSRPVFSDQGDRIAFIRRGQRGERITVMTVSPDGSDVRELATNFMYWAPTGLDWSPDGSALIVSGGGADGELAAVVRSDGSGFQPLGSGFQPLDFGPAIFDFRASWRPDGRHIAIEANQEVGTPDNDVYPRGLFLADADGTNVRQLIGPVAHLGGVEWSPDGRHLSFASDGPAGIDQVSIADIDEDGELTALRQLRLDPESSDETRPKWSPDGSQLAVLVSKGSGSTSGSSTRTARASASSGRT